MSGSGRRGHHPFGVLRDAGFAAGMGGDFDFAAADEMSERPDGERDAQRQIRIVLAGDAEAESAQRDALAAGLEITRSDQQFARRTAAVCGFGMDHLAHARRAGGEQFHAIHRQGIGQAQRELVAAF